LAAKNHALGTTFTWNSVSIAGLTAINGIELTADQVDVTTHLSTSGYEEILVGIKRTGTATLEGYFDYTDTTGQHAMVTDFGAGTSRTGVITFPSATGTTWTFTGYITAIKIGDAGIDGAIPFTATIKPTGVPTFAVATVVGMSGIEFPNDVLIMPAFAIGRYGAANPYVVTITALETATVVTPVDATGGEVITITTDGASSQVVATGEASSPCTLDVDDVTQIIVTISKTGCAPKAYYFNCAVLAG
jgi:predicted secreted protein